MRDGKAVSKKKGELFVECVRLWKAGLEGNLKAWTFCFLEVEDDVCGHLCLGHSLDGYPLVKTKRLPSHFYGSPRRKPRGQNGSCVRHPAMGSRILVEAQLQ